MYFFNYQQIQWLWSIGLEKSVLCSRLQFVHKQAGLTWKVDTHKNTSHRNTLLAKFFIFLKEIRNMTFQVKKNCLLVRKEITYWEEKVLNSHFEVPHECFLTTIHVELSTLTAEWWHANTKKLFTSRLKKTRIQPGIYDCIISPGFTCPELKSIGILLVIL